MRRLLLVAMAGLGLQSCTLFAPKTYTPRAVGGKLEGVLSMRYGGVYYTDVAHFDSLQPNMTFRQTRRWVALNISSTPSALGLTDGAIGDLLVSGRMGVTRIEASPDERMPSYSDPVLLGITIESNPGSYRISLGNFRTEQTIQVADYTGGKVNFTPVRVEVPLEETRYYDRTEAINHFKYIDRVVREWFASLKQFVAEESK